VSLTQDIKEYALDIGNCKVGISPATEFTSYIAQLREREDMYSFYINDPRQPLSGANPKTGMPTAKSIISVAFDYARESFPDTLLKSIGRAYLSRAYTPPPHRINGTRNLLMHEFLVKKGIQVSNALSLPQRQAAARAGVITYGNNNFAYVDGVGSFVILHSFIVDAELDYDEPTMIVKCPEGCNKCQKACPTGAIYEPLKLNPRKCISYNCWFTTGRPGISSYIPPKIREKMGQRVHGCDVCQEACPRNAKRLKLQLPENEFLALVARDFSLTKMLHMDGGFYESRVVPLMYNYIKEKKYFQRNAAIALGNTRDPAFIGDLARAMDAPDDVIRSYAAWALGQIGGQSAKAILERKLSLETEPAVKAEIKDALAKA